MSGLLRPDQLAAEDRTPEIEAVLEGRDEIALAPDLLGDEPAPASPATKEAPREALAVRIRKLAVPARVKLALTGGKEPRQILARDHVKLVQQCVLYNPRISLEEVAAMAKNRSLHGELLRHIASQRDWVRQYAVRLALVTNPKTPLQVALNLFGGIQERDVRLLAKSRNVPSVLQAQARRALLRREPSRGDG